jgi:hypothetical protein
MTSDYLESARKQFEYYKLLGDKALARVPDDKLYWQYNAESNSMATLIKHLSGNMLSRWTDFLTSDGEKEWRQREEEFENNIRSRDELMRQWQKGWDCLFNSLNILTANDLNKTIYIRSEPHSVMEAINRQLAHYPYHVGQMVFIGKMICDDKWVSLSIPKGGTQAFNNEKLGNPLK